MENDFAANLQLTKDDTNDNGDWKLVWQDPTNFEECGDVTYEIKLNGEDVPEYISGREHTIEFSSLKMCKQNKVDVYPIIDGKKGESNQLSEILRKLLVSL